MELSTNVFKDTMRNSFYNWLTKGLEFETVLDVGAGNGRFSKYCLERNKIVNAIDLDPQIDFVIKEDFWDFETKEFDLVYCSHVIEHQKDFQGFANKLKACTGKYLIMLAPSPTKYFWDEPTHVRPFTIECLKRMIDLKVIKSFNFTIPFLSDSIGVVFEKEDSK